MAEPPKDRELEGWKEIAAFLGASENSVKRYRLRGTKTRAPLPAMPNFRSRISIMESIAREWKDGGRFTKGVQQEPPTLRPHALGVQ